MIKTEILLTGFLMFMVAGSFSAQEYLTDDTAYADVERDWEPFIKFLDSMSPEEREESLQEAIKKVREYYLQEAELLRIV